MSLHDGNCPYCGADIEINHDDGYGYEENTLHQQECWKCSKTFTFDTTIHFSYELHLAACLNDGEHVWEKTKTWPVEFAKLRCKTCGEEKPIPKDKP
jgi:hypothetical protein